MLGCQDWQELLELASKISTTEPPRFVCIKRLGPVSYSGISFYNSLDVSKSQIVNYDILCISDQEMKPFPQPYATALFSFLYHLASYENGEQINT